MKNTIQFETPENVKVSYEVAGLGSRFVAWVEDQLLLGLGLFIFILILMFFGMGSNWVGEYMISPESEDEAVLYFFGLATLVMGFASFCYYGLSELLMRGQTIGKKHNNIRVVKVNGYALDAGSIMLRNIFRVLDHIPLAWIVPLVSKKSQRLGDMVAGTLCITDEPSKLGSLREVLLARPPAERQFRFDISALNKVRAQDFEAVERVLEGLPAVPEEKQFELCRLLSLPLAQRMQIAEPETEQQRQFLEDLMAAEYRRQERQLG